MKEVTRIEKCAYCRELFDSLDLTDDHMIPKGKGGCNHSHNVVKCCSACNTLKRDTMLDVWLDSIRIGMELEIAKKIIRSICCISTRMEAGKSHGAILASLNEKLHREVNKS